MCSRSFLDRMIRIVYYISSISLHLSNSSFTMLSIALSTTFSERSSSYKSLYSL